MDLDPNKVQAYHVSTTDITDAIKKSNSEVEGNLFDKSSMSFMVRGLGYIKGIHDLENVQVAVHGGTPIFVKDIGRVQMGVQTRRGLIEKDGKGEAVGGIVVMRYGENAKPGNRTRKGKNSRDTAWAPQGGKDRRLLRPLGSDRPRGAYPKARVDRRIDNRLSRDAGVPPALPKRDSHRPDAARSRC